MEARRPPNWGRARTNHHSLDNRMPSCPRQGREWKPHSQTDMNRDRHLSSRRNLAGPSGGSVKGPLRCPKGKCGRPGRHSLASSDAPAFVIVSRFAFAVSSDLGRATRNDKRETRNPKRGTILLDGDLSISIGLPSQMAKLRPRRLPTFKAVFAAVLLATGSISAQASLLTRSVDACSMACCVEQGHCCCSPRHANVREVLRPGQTSIESPLISSPCPDGCARSQAVNNLFAKYGRHANVFPSRLLNSLLPRSHQAAVALDAALIDSFPPRGPPHSVLNPSV